MENWDTSQLEDVLDFIETVYIEIGSLKITVLIDRINKEIRQRRKVSLENKLGDLN